MRNRPVRQYLPAALRSSFAIATLCLAMAMSATASARLAVGLSDGNTAFFSDPFFQRLHVTVARDTVPWDIAVRRDRTLLVATRNWLEQAHAANVTPLVSFANDKYYTPTVAQYRSAVQKFLRDFPSVHNYTAWNEPDWFHLSLSRTPLLAAAFYNTLVSLCGRCTVAAGDVYLPAPQLGPWLRRYIPGLRQRPKAWAIHPYDDVRGHSTAQLRTLMRYTSGPVWLDEISGVERRGHWRFPSQQSAAAAGRDERFLFSLPKRFHRIAAIYHYQWLSYPTAHWDSALIASNGTPRPAYFTFAAATRGQLP